MPISLAAIYEILLVESILSEFWQVQIYLVLSSDVFFMDFYVNFSNKLMLPALHL